MTGILKFRFPLAIAASGVTKAMTVTVAPALLAGEGSQRDLLLMALADRLLQAGAERHVDGLVLAWAGSSSQRARTDIESLARDLERLHGIPVEPAFASAGSPSPTQALEALSNKRIRRPAVASLFVAAGRLSDSVVAACADVAVPTWQTSCHVFTICFTVRPHPMSSSTCRRDFRE